MKVVTTNQLQSEIERVISCQAVSIDMVTEPDFRKTDNPYFGRVLKYGTISGLIGFVYANACNNQLARELKDENFESQPRKWGERVGNLVHHKGKVYVEVKVQSATEPEYRLDGKVIDKSLIEAWLPKKQAPKTQADLVKKVIVRDVTLSNITGMRLMGESYIVGMQTNAQEVAAEVAETVNA